MRFVHLVQRHAGSADAGVGHDDVQPAQLLDAAVDGRLERVEVTDVDFGGHDAAIERLDQVRGLGEVLGRRRRDRVVVDDGPADVDGDDVGALLRQPDRVAASLTARGARDESNLALYPSGHCYLDSLCCSRIFWRTRYFCTLPLAVRG
jgi:hypothetical protein